MNKFILPKKLSPEQSANPQADSQQKNTDQKAKPSTPRKRSTAVQNTNKRTATKSKIQLNQYETSILGYLDLLGMLTFDQLKRLQTGNSKKLEEILKRLHRKNYLELVYKRQNAAKQIVLIRQASAGKDILARLLEIPLAELEKRHFTTPTPERQQAFEICTEIFIQAYIAQQKGEIEIIDTFSRETCYREQKNGKLQSLTQFNIREVHGLMAFVYHEQVMLSAIVIDSLAQFPPHLLKIKNQDMVSLIRQLDGEKHALFQEITSQVVANSHLVTMVITNSTRRLQALLSLLKPHLDKLHRKVLFTTSSQITNDFFADIWLNTRGDKESLPQHIKSLI